MIRVNTIRQYVPLQVQHVCSSFHFPDITSRKRGRTILLQLHQENASQKSPINCEKKGLDTDTGFLCTDSRRFSTCFWVSLKSLRCSQQFLFLSQLRYSGRHALCLLLPKHLHPQANPYVCNSQSSSFTDRNLSDDSHLPFQYGKYLASPPNLWNSCLWRHVRLTRTWSSPWWLLCWQGDGWDDLVGLLQLECGWCDSNQMGPMA